MSVLALMNASTVNVTNGSYTAVTTPLDGATTIQVYIRPSSTAQAFTVKLPNDTTIEVPSGNSFTVSFKAPTGIGTSDTLFSVQTGTGSAVLQVVAWRDQ